MFPSPRDSLSRFVVGTAGSATLLCLLWYCLSNPLTEAVDAVYFLTALGVGGVAYAARFRGRMELAVTALGLVGFAAMLWGLVTVEHKELVNTLWLGFGSHVVIATLLILPLVGFLLRPELLAKTRYRVSFYVGLSAIAGVGALSFIQTRTSLSLPEHSSYIFNELYAIAAGHYPYTDFVPQYQTLFSYLFYPVIALLGAEHSLNPLLGLLFLLSVLTIGLGVSAGLMATRGLNRMIAPLLILPLVLLTQGPDRTGWAGSISALHSAFPVRMLMPTLIGVLMAAMPVLGAQKWYVHRHILPLGALLGLACFHQIDFGLAAAFAVGTVIVVAEPPRRLPRFLGLLASGVVAGFTTVPLLHWMADKPLDLQTIGWFVRQFGGGFGSEPIRIPGPVLVVLPLIVGATATCLAALRAECLPSREGGWAEIRFLVGVRRQAAVGTRADKPPLDGSLESEAPQAPTTTLNAHSAALIGSYFGVFAVAAFPYYLNRSYASGQLQILLLPLGVTLAASAQIIATSPQWSDRRRSVQSLVFRLALAIPVASLLLLPSPSHEWARLNSEGAETKWPGERTASIIAIGQSWKKLGTYDSVGYWGNDGNYIESITGIRNVSRFSSPLDGTMSAAARDRLCAGIAREDLTTLILGDGALNPSLCKIKWQFRKTPKGLIIARKQPAALASVSSP